MIAPSPAGIAARRRRTHGDGQAPLARALVARHREALVTAQDDKLLRRDVGVLEYIVACSPSPMDVAVFDCAAARIRAYLRADPREIAAVHRALRRIVTGDYGRCSMCARTIALERMRRFVDAEICAPCESARRGMRARDEDAARGAKSPRCGAREARASRSSASKRSRPSR